MEREDELAAFSIKDLSSRRAFILEHTRLIAPPHTPEIRLQLADEATALWEKTEEELGQIGLAPPFWAFAWAGGQALARYILDNPKTVADKSVFDFASGSGIVAIAAAMAGARNVQACDIDRFAVSAIAVNAQANAVAVEPIDRDLIGEDRGWDVVFAGDVCYEADMARAVTDWLERLHRRGAAVYIGDPGRAYLPRERLTSQAQYRVPVTRALEDCEIKRTEVWRFNKPLA